MSFLQTLLGLAHHSQSAGHASQGLSPNVQLHPAPNQGLNAGQAVQSGGMTMDGRHQSLLNHLAQPQMWEDGSGINMGQMSPQQLNLGVNSQPVQGAGSFPLQSGIQGGTYNPGYTPLQNNGFGPGGNPQMYGHQNPQVKDYGYYWNN